MKTLRKVFFDNDYPSVYYDETISSPEKVEESWSGKDFLYYDEHGTRLSTEQAKQYLKVNNQ